MGGRSWRRKNTVTELRKRASDTERERVARTKDKSEEESCLKMNAWRKRERGCGKQHLYF